MTDITRCCRECGLAANTLTCLVKYGTLPRRPCFDVSTFHGGICECCLRKVAITEARDFFYPDFSLVGREFVEELRKGGSKGLESATFDLSRMLDKPNPE